MSMKRFLWLLVVTLYITNALAIDQLGIAYKYNGKKQRTPIGGVYVKVATSRNSVVSDKKNGQFVLKLDGLGMGDPLGMAAVSKKGMMVFNKEEVDRWSVQKKPLVLILCEANEFQKLKDRLVVIGRSQAKKKQKQELAKLEALNAKKQLTLEQYYAKRESIDKKMEHALAHMDEYADLFARIDESEIDAVSQKAFDLFKQGYIDEAIALFKKNEQKAKMPSIREKAEEMRQLADSAESLAQRDIDENMKQAKAYVEALKYKGEWEEAERVLKVLADAFGSFEAMMETGHVDRTSCCLLVDKEEIGSVGATGMHSRFFENTVAELVALTEGESDLKVRRALMNSRMLSSDVSAAYDPMYAEVFEKRSSAFFGKGLVFNKFTGARGKSGSNDANAEYLAKIRNAMDAQSVAYQFAELGKVDAGGGGTIAYIMANYGMEVIDSGVAVLSMHAPWEVTSKADVYEAYKGYKAFIEEMR